MRKLLTLLVALAAIVGAAPRSFGQFVTLGAQGCGGASCAGGGSGSPPVLDGTPQSGINFFGTSQATGSLTTTAGSGVIVLAAQVDGGFVPSGVPTATGLTFTPRSTTTVGSSTVATFTAPYSTNFTGTIALNTTGTGTIIQLAAFAIGHAPTSSYFDPNASVPNVVASGDPTITTSNANDFLFAVENTTGTGPTAGTGFTELIPFTFNNFMVQYQIVSATGSYTAALGSGGPALGAIMDAIK
jgi:hypothetical protein